MRSIIYPYKLYLNTTVCKLYDKGCRALRAKLNQNKYNMSTLGFSLIEFAVSLVLVSIILCALIQQYTQLKQHDEIMHSSLDEAMEVQFTLDFIRGRIQQAGFTPCRALHYLQIVDHRPLKDDVAALTVIPQGIVTRRMSETYALAQTISHSHDIKLLATNKWLPGQVVMIADCEHAELHVVTEIYLNDKHVYVRFQSPLSFSYPAGLYISPWVEERFLMMPNKSGDNVLIYEGKHTEMLTPNIKKMQITQEADKIQVVFELKQQGHLAMHTRLRMP